MLWSLLTAAVVIWADRRYRLGHGRAFALYLAMYGTARAVLELLRVDEVNLVLGVRVNQLAALLVVVLDVGYILISSRRRPGRETHVEGGTAAAAEDVDETTRAGELSGTTPTRAPTGTSAGNGRGSSPRRRHPGP